MTVLRDWKPEMEYIAVRMPDKMLVTSIINEAKGNRTMAQLADVCGVSASTLSRTASGKKMKAMSIDLIKTIANNAEKQDPSLFERLARANGLVPKELYGEKFNPAKLDAYQQQYRQRRADEARVRDFIMAELINRGLPVKLVKYGDKPISSQFLLTLPNNFQVDTDLGNGPVIWSFMVIPYTLTDAINSNLPPGFYLKKVMDNMSGWFLADAWEPKSLTARLHSFLFIDGGFYSFFEDRLIGPKVNNDFSFIVLDMESGRIKNEVYMIRKDGKEHELIFARPAIDAGNESGDTWQINYVEEENNE